MVKLTRQCGLGHWRVDETYIAYLRAQTYWAHFYCTKDYRSTEKYDGNI